MLSREELKEHHLTFWTGLKKFLPKARPGTSKKVNWLSYPTGIKHIYLRLHADKTQAAVRFDFQYKDETVRAVFWEQMLELKKVLTEQMGDEGIWYENQVSEEGFVFNRIEWRLSDVNYLNPAHEEQIFRFFKEKLLAFDLFYQDFKEILLFLAK